MDLLKNPKYSNSEKQLAAEKVLKVLSNTVLLHLKFADVPEYHYNPTLILCLDKKLIERITYDTFYILCGD